MAGLVIITDNYTSLVQLFPAMNVISCYPHDDHRPVVY